MVKTKNDKDQAFGDLFFKDKHRAFHKALTRGIEHEYADFTQSHVVNMIGGFLYLCQEFGLDPIPHLRTCFPRFVWRSYNTDKEAGFNYGTALGHTDIVFFLEPIVVTMKWQKKKYSCSNLLHLCWLSESANVNRGIREAIAQSGSKKVTTEYGEIGRWSQVPQ